MGFGSRRMRKQPGGESGRHSCMGMEPSTESSSWQCLARMERDLVARTTALGTADPCCERGEPAGVLFDATARDDQHEYTH